MNLQALDISTREISKKENESQVRMYIHNEENENLKNVKAYYYIKGTDLKVEDNYTPNCSLYVEELSGDIKRVVLDFSVEKIHEFSLPTIPPNTSGFMFTIYSENGDHDRTENPSHIERGFFTINDSIDVVDENGNVLYGNKERVYRYHNFSVSPNPVDDVLNIAYKGNRATYSFELINSALSTVKTWQMSFTGEQEETKSVNITTIPSAVYTLLIKHGGVVVRSLQFYKK